MGDIACADVSEDEVLSMVSRGLAILSKKPGNDYILMQEPDNKA
jgi:hypothetical protein